MAMFGIAATHVQCVECGATYEITNGQDPGSATCPTDGAAVTAVAIIPCPQKVLSDCTDTSHLPESTSHIVRVDG